MPRQQRLAYIFPSLISDKVLEISQHVHNAMPNSNRGAQAFLKWKGIDKKGQFCRCPESNNFMSFASRTNFWKCVVSITSEMAFTESLLQQKAHFLSSKSRAFIQEILFSFFLKLMGHFSPEKTTFFHF